MTINISPPNKVINEVPFLISSIKTESSIINIKLSTTTLAIRNVFKSFSSFRYVNYNIKKYYCQ